MKSGLKLTTTAMADLDPKDPTPAIPIKIVTDPTPAIPIKIVTDPEPAPAADDVAPIGKRSDEFYPAWDSFLYVEPKRAKRTSRAAQKIDEEKKLVKETPGDGLQIQQNAGTSLEQATAECKAKVAAIENECIRLNQKYRDANFDLESGGSSCLSSLSGAYPAAVDKIDAPPWIKRVEDIFDKPEFFIDGATATDVHQGSGGDCWFLASLMAVSAKKDLIERLCVARNEKVGVYGFVFYRDGEWIHEVIDDKLYLRVGDDDDLTIVRDWDVEKREGSYLRWDDEKLKEALQKGGEALYFSHCKSSETWLPLIEKAYAKAHGDYYAIEGGFASEGIEDLTGGVAVVLNPEDIMDKERFWKEQLSQVNKKYLFGGGSKPSSPKGLISGHAYAVLEAWEEGDLKLVKIRNPWGDTEWEGDWSDGSKLWTAEMMTKLKHTFGDDGVFWMSYKDFLKHFPCINRVRLFDDSWTIGQQWTCVDVPWTVDYMDSKFQFTVSERGPVVIVLAQPDDRYFYGLRGRYLFSLHFRVYKEGEDSRWIVRSMHNSGNETVFTRSVSAEIEDLEPGTYDVVFKITTYRNSSFSTAEEAILKYAVDKKKKLLDVGRRFDYAQSKGNLRAMEKEVRDAKKEDRKAKQKKAFKKDRKYQKQVNEKSRKRKQRIADAMREKRKTAEQQRREKVKSRAKKGKKKKTETREENESTDVQPGASASDDSSPPSSLMQSKSSVEASEIEGAKGMEAEPSATADSVTTETKTAPASAVAKPEFEGSQAETSAQQATQESPLAQVLEKLKVQDEDEDEDKHEPKKVEEVNKPPVPSISTSISISPLAALSSKPNFEDDADEDDDADEEEENGYDSPVEPPEELDDDDFDWDSEMDGPVDSRCGDSDSDDDNKDLVQKNSEAIFAEDPWNALCVLGVRVYSKCKDVEVRVVKGGDGEED